MTIADLITAAACLAGAAAGAALFGVHWLAVILALLATAATLSALRDLLHREDRS